MIDNSINNTVQTKTVKVYDPETCNGIWPGTTEMTDAGLVAQNQAYQRGAGQRETIMAIWNAMVKAHP